jgi:hypothetical protein
MSVRSGARLFGRIRAHCRLEQSAVLRTLQKPIFATCSSGLRDQLSLHEHSWWTFSM